MATGCTCGLATGAPCPAGQRHLRYYYRGQSYPNGVEQSSYFDACVGYCNPLNCSNSACATKSCTQARNIFCSQWGKPCPDGKKYCYINGRDPCPTCSFNPNNATIDNAKEKVTDAIINLCGYQLNGYDYNRSVIKGWTAGYPSGLNQIVAYWKACSLTAANNHILFVANAIRCSHKTHEYIRGRCDSGIPNCTTSGGTPPPPAGTECNENPVTWGNCFGNWFKGSCHIFDFLPGGGCNQWFQTVSFFFLVGLGVFAFVTLIRR